MNNAELEIMLRLPHILRWQIVRTFHRQSVAEHSYRVWLLATHLYDTLFPVPHNTYARDMLQRWALVHDVDEVLTGDIPSTVKAMLEGVSPGVMEKFNDRVLVGMPSVAATRRGIRGTLEDTLVKVADNVEAVLYLQQDGMGDISAVVESRRQALASLYSKGKARFTDVEWPVVAQWVIERIGVIYGIG